MNVTLRGKQFIPEMKKLSIKVWHTNQIFSVTNIYQMILCPINKDSPYKVCIY